MDSYGNNDSTYGSSGMGSERYGNNEMSSTQGSYGRNSGSDRMNTSSGMGSDFGSDWESRFERRRDSDAYGSQGTSGSGRLGGRSSGGYNNSDSSLDSDRSSGYGQRHETSSGYGSSRRDDDYSSSNNSYNSGSSSNKHNNTNGSSGLMGGLMGGNSEGKRDYDGDGYNGNNNNKHSGNKIFSDKIIDSAVDYAKKQW